MNDRIKVDAVVKFFAEKIIEKILVKSISNFQRCKDTLSGQDSGLINIWDEICVQIQLEYSFYWDVYEETVSYYLESQVKKLSETEKFAIWLQSDEGFYYDEEEDDFPDYIDPEVISFLKNMLFERAGRWSNSRIRNYMEL